MDTTVWQILKNSSAAVLRALIIVFATWLVAKGKLPSSVNDILAQHADSIATGTVVILSTVGWSIYQKIHMNKKVDAALEAPKGTPRAVFEEKLDAAAK